MQWQPQSACPLHGRIPGGRNLCRASRASVSEGIAQGQPLIANPNVPLWFVDIAARPRRKVRIGHSSIADGCCSPLRNQCPCRAPDVALGHTTRSAPSAARFATHIGARFPLLDSRVAHSTLRGWLPLSSMPRTCELRREQGTNRCGRLAAGEKDSQAKEFTRCLRKAWLTRSGWASRKEHQPPSLYRLLAIDALEPDSEVIANAAKSRMGFVRQFQVGENAKLAAEIVNELAQAKNVLLNLQARAAYDAQLRASSGADGHQPASGRPALAAAPDAKANRSDTATPEETRGQADSKSTSIDAGRRGSRRQPGCACRPRHRIVRLRAGIGGFKQTSTSGAGTGQPVASAGLGSEGCLRGMPDCPAGIPGR